MDDFSLSHTKWKCQYHIVFIPKYRRKVMYGKVMEDVRAIIQTLCENKTENRPPVLWENKTENRPLS